MSATAPCDGSRWARRISRIPRSCCTRQACRAVRPRKSSGFSQSLVAKGSYFGINLATDDLDATFAAVEAKGADIVQEPIEQDYGVRDAAFRDPAGNLIRIQQSKEH